MPRDVCAVSENLSPACVSSCAYDGSGDFLQEHAYQQPERDKQVAINVGRYISSDPIGLGGGLNTFGYAAQNPVNRFDLNGLDWVYFQDSGVIAHYPMSFQNPPTSPISTGQGPNPDYVGQGYAGKGIVLNNPSAQCEIKVGPIPQGQYQIGYPYTSKTLGPLTMNIVPAPGTDTCGRDLFRIHGDNQRGDYSASEGCIILPPGVRQRVIYELVRNDDYTLWVVP